MSKIQKILVPTDFSEEANNALEVAVAIAERANASITLLHVVDVPSGGRYEAPDMLGRGGGEVADPNLHQQYMARLVRITRERINELIANYPGVRIEEHVVFDSFQKELAKFVAENDTDLTVIGSKGSSGIDEILVGSNAEKVIRYAKTPVLTVKSKVVNFRADKMVFASNFKNVLPEIVNTLKAYQELFDATIHFVKIITPNTFETTPDTEKIIKKFIDKNGFSDVHIHVFNFFTEEEGIRAFGENIGADMLAMVTHGRTGLSHLLFGSIAEEVANHSMIPVLTFNQNFK